MTDVAAKYRKLLDQIAEAAVRGGRHAQEVRLLAAAKSQCVEAIKEATTAGVSLIGENYVQEAQEIKKQITEPIEWHMIGHLQRNKAKVAVELFDVIESLDNIALARELDKEGKKHGKTIRAFIEMNLAGEESKTGVAKNELPALLDEVAKLTNLNVEGLMTVPPSRDNLDELRPYFRELRELRTKLNELNIQNVNPTELSMGMTHDFVVAIEEGATIVRIGTALFGPRQN
jgi:pyridoxal phosphate enzyme (YggS family)